MRWLPAYVFDNGHVGSPPVHHTARLPVWPRLAKTQATILGSLVSEIEFCLRGQASHILVRRCLSKAFASLTNPCKKTSLIAQLVTVTQEPAPPQNTPARRCCSMLMFSLTASYHHYRLRSALPVPSLVCHACSPPEYGGNEPFS